MGLDLPHIRPCLEDGAIFVARKLSQACGVSPGLEGRWWRYFRKVSPDRNLIPEVSEKTTPKFKDIHDSYSTIINHIQPIFNHI